MTRNDTFAGTAELQRIAQNAAPEAEVNVTAYLGGQFGERHAIIVAASVPRPITEAERQSDTAAAFRPNPMSENKTVYGPVQSLAGGTIQCATAITKLSQPDALGGTMYSNVQCISIGYNTELELNESEVLSGMSLVKVADDLARFRSVAEVPR
ncbi:hypothetical protein [Kitasatospora sp. NPDC101183]|uniref:hypothetical protein n=1 Tax=Kitasatospora sp. NPDC101183 TaxID=3364100 RepID=UPI00380F9863